MLSVVKFVGDGLVDRHRHRVGGGLAFIAGVDGLGFKFHNRVSSVGESRGIPYRILRRDERRNFSTAIKTAADVSTWLGSVPWS